MAPFKLMSATEVQVDTGQAPAANISTIANAGKVPNAPGRSIAELSIGSKATVVAPIPQALVPNIVPQGQTQATKPDAAINRLDVTQLGLDAIPHDRPATLTALFHDVFMPRRMSDTISHSTPSQSSPPFLSGLRLGTALPRVLTFDAPASIDLAGSVTKGIANAQTAVQIAATVNVPETLPALGWTAGESNQLFDLSALPAETELAKAAAPHSNSVLPRGTVNLPAPAAQVAIQIGKAVQDGMSRINIRLNPPELGRVDVKLDLGFDGRILAVISVERTETLELLQRDSRLLERALEDAGLETSSNSLSFNLRGRDDSASDWRRELASDTESAASASGEASPEAGPHINAWSVSNRAVDINV